MTISSSEPTLTYDPELDPGYFIQVSSLFVRHTSIAIEAKQLYMVLLAYVIEQATEFPAQSVLAAQVGVSEKTLRSAVCDLQDLSLLSVRRRGQGKPSIYHVHKMDLRPATKWRDVSEQNLNGKNDRSRTVKTTVQEPADLPFLNGKNDRSLLRVTEKITEKKQGEEEEYAIAHSSQDAPAPGGAPTPNEPTVGLDLFGEDASGQNKPVPSQPETVAEKKETVASACNSFGTAPSQLQPPAPGKTRSGARKSDLEPGAYSSQAMINFGRMFVRQRRLDEKEVRHPIRDMKLEAQAQRCYDAVGPVQYQRALDNFFSCFDGTDPYVASRGYDLGLFVRQFEKWEGGQAPPPGVRATHPTDIHAPPPPSPLVYDAAKGAFVPRAADTDPKLTLVQPPGR